MQKKGQVSTEFLVILAVVLVVVLIIAGLVSGVTPISSGVTQTQSENYWSATTPFMITGWKYTGKNLSLTIQNLGAQKVTLTDITVKKHSAYSENTTFSVGETRTIYATTKSNCGGSGRSFEITEIKFVFTKNGITDLIQVGEKPLVGTCS